MLWQEETHITWIQQKIYINWFVFDCSHCWESLADAYYGRGAYTSALKSYQRVLELDPDAIYPAFQMGTIKQVSMSSVLWSHLVINRFDRTYIQWIFCILHLVICTMDLDIPQRSCPPLWLHMFCTHVYDKFCFHKMPVMQHSLLSCAGTEGTVHSSLWTGMFLVSLTLGLQYCSNSRLQEHHFWLREEELYCHDPVPTIFSNHDGWKSHRFVVEGSSKTL